MAFWKKKGSNVNTGLTLNGSLNDAWCTWQMLRNNGV